MQLTPAQVGMSLLIHGGLPMMRHPTRAEGIARGRQSLIRITEKDFGYDLHAWHEHLIATNAGGYKWSNIHRGFPSEIEKALRDVDWQHDVELAVSESLLERLTERDARQRLAMELAERQWGGRIRTCPKCLNEFRSVKDRGQCTRCSHVFYASHPNSGSAMWWLDVT